MRQRIGLLAAAAVAALVPLGAATSAHATQEFPHLAGIYATQDECQAAGVAGHDLWGPVFLCQGVGLSFYLYTH
ncbi:hypothetical protein RVR_6203 [Actinacidiphila reveromycinica]|uniref:Secreted protein n=1 Tax=Actinacidiphila reveromycinica TaxID=659352 RepID=A0A7U3VQ74_9ACTN|nr:hypothetical protein [Streptomyces sp. SN-593]BBA99537.1 hypothetical protein RVR_6203 [Streptomyces sp. SN-593]